MAKKPASKKRTSSHQAQTKAKHVKQTPKFNKSNKKPRLVEDWSDRYEDDDDESIDEETAFNAEDEKRFGGLFKETGSKAKGKGEGKKSRNKTVKIEESSDDEASSEDEENSEEEDASTSSSSQEDDTSDEDENDDEEEDDDDSDDEGGIASDDDDEDGDGGQYMLDLLENLDKKKNSEETENKKQQTRLAQNVKESAFSSSIVPNAQVTLDQLMHGISDTQGFNKLQQRMAPLSGVALQQNARTNRKNKSSKEQQQQQEAPIVPKSKLQTTPAPVSKVISERAKRMVHYEDQKKEVSLWQSVVSLNREADSLDFRPSYEATKMTKDDLVDKFTPESEFEKEIMQALEGAASSKRKHENNTHDQDNPKEDEEEDDDLGRSNMTLEEFKQRHGALAKMRAQMSYEQRKSAHTHKIKSKVYRRIRKRAEQKRAAANGEELDEQAKREQREKEELARMQERMTLAHKNTSKWAKQQLRRGKHMDLEARRALSAQLQKGEELRQKTKSIRGEEESSDEEELDEEQLAERARAVLLDDGSKGQEEAPKGLFGMKFMQRGIQKQRERAKEEARQLLRELEEDDGGMSDAEQYEKDQQKKDQKRKEMDVNNGAGEKQVVEEGKLTVSASAKHTTTSAEISLDPSTSEHIKVQLVSTDEDNSGKETSETTASSASSSSSEDSSDEDEDEDDSSSDENEDSKSRKSGEKKDWILQPLATYDSQHQTEPPSQSSGSKESKIEKKKAAATVSPAQQSTSNSNYATHKESNPWLQPSSSSKKKSKRTTVSANGDDKSHKGKTVVVNVQEAARMLAPSNDTTPKDDDENGQNNDQQGEIISKSEKKQRKANVLELTQEELVRQAFAAPTDAEVDEEFEKEKEALRQREDPTRRPPKEEETVAGWGSWTGAGAPPPSSKRHFRPGMEPPKKKKQQPPKRRADDGLRQVILRTTTSKKLAALQMQKIPYPYTSRKEYERAMMGAVGKEWNVTQAVKSMTVPEVQQVSGRIVVPLDQRLKKKRKGISERGPAKF